MRLFLSALFIHSETIGNVATKATTFRRHRNMIKVARNLTIFNFLFSKTKVLGARLHLMIQLADK